MIFTYIWVMFSIDVPNISQWTWASFFASVTRVGSPPCLNVDAVKLIETTPSTARGQSFEELSHLGKRGVNQQKNNSFNGETSMDFNGRNMKKPWDLGPRGNRMEQTSIYRVEFYPDDLDCPNFRGMTRPLSTDTSQRSTGCRPESDKTYKCLGCLWDGL